MKSNVAHIVYRQLLCQSGHGYPLWTPEPDQSLSHEYRQRGISVGDVGILTERGGFDFLFNIHEAANGSINEEQVPPGFESWPLPNRDTSVYPFIHKERGSVISSSVSRKSIMFDAEAELGFVAGGGFGFEFSTENDQAAILVLPHGATGYNAKHRGRYEEYAKKNAKAWYAYANGALGCGAANGTLYLVTGCDKARSWATAAVSQPSQTRTVSLKFLAGGFAESAISFQSSWSHDFGAETRLYPPSSGSSTLDEIQCVFTRGFTIAIRQNLLGRAIKGSVHVSSTAPNAFPKAPQSYWPPPGSRDNTGARQAQPSPTLHDTLSADPISVPSGHLDLAPGTTHRDHVPSHAWGEGSDSDIEVVVERFPSDSEDQVCCLYTHCSLVTQHIRLCNPSSIICTSILKHHEDIDIAMVHDDDWASIFRSSSGRPNTVQWNQFLSKIVEYPETISRNILVKDDSGCAVLSSSWYTMISEIVGWGQFQLDTPHDPRILLKESKQTQIHPRQHGPPTASATADIRVTSEMFDQPENDEDRLIDSGQMHDLWPEAYHQDTAYLQPQSYLVQPSYDYGIVSTHDYQDYPKPAQTKTSHKRKREIKGSRDVPALSDSDDDGGGIQIGGLVGPLTQSNGRKSRYRGACTHCKKLKMKCDFSPGDTTNTCKRCKSGGHVCIVEGRKPRMAPNKREYLLAQIRQKDTIIEGLLKQLDNPYLTTPLNIASHKDVANNQVRNGSDMDDSSASDEDNGEWERVNDDKGEQDSQVPLGLIANLSSTTERGKRSRRGRGGGGMNLATSSETGRQRVSTNKKVLGEEGIDDENVAVANEHYFMLRPATSLDERAMLLEQRSPPKILVLGLVTPSDVDELFSIYYRNVDPFISLLDPVLHTPQTTFSRCPFLFDVICAISSRYHPVKSSIYPVAMHFAKNSAANSLLGGWKNVELCQAYILMSIHAVPARRWEEDRSWLYTGLAIRIATDLNLHLASSAPPPNGNRTEEHEREQLNRDRVWQICFNLDRSIPTQFGKPTTITDDRVIQDCVNWYKRSKYNNGYDVHLCGHTVLLRIVARFHDEVWATAGGQSGRMNMKELDFRKITLPYDRKLDVYQDTWYANFKEVGGDAGAQMRYKLLPFLVAYSRLVMFSFGFQQAYSSGIREDDDLFFKKCLESAKTVVRCMALELIPTGFMRFAPDDHFIFSAFASAFLLKLMRPEFMSSGKSQPSPSLLKKADEEEIFMLIGKLIEALSDSSVSIDEHHTPRLYARFLAGLLDKCKQEAASPPASVTALEYPQQYRFPTNSSNTEYQYSKQQESVAYQQGPPVHLGAEEIHMKEPAILATLKDPSWWDTMMMPGFQWMDQDISGAVTA